MELRGFTGVYIRTLLRLLVVGVVAAGKQHSGNCRTVSSRSFSRVSFLVVAHDDLLDDSLSGDPSLYNTDEVVPVVEHEQASELGTKELERVAPLPMWIKLWRTELVRTVLLQER